MSEARWSSASLGVAPIPRTGMSGDDTVQYPSRPTVKRMGSVNCIYPPNVCMLARRTDPPVPLNLSNMYSKTSSRMRGLDPAPVTV